LVPANSLQRSSERLAADKAEIQLMQQEIDAFIADGGAVDAMDQFSNPRGSEMLTRWDMVRTHLTFL
jgi:hypothetical protein